MLEWLHMDNLKVKPIAEIDLLGSHPAMNFVNTVHSRFKDGNSDYLQSFADLVAWHQRIGLITATTGRQLLTSARSQPEQAEAILKFSIEVRELLYRIFLSVIQNKPQIKADVDQLNQTVSNLRCCQQLVLAGQGMKFEWHIDTARLETMLGPVVESAVELLTSPRLNHVKECPAPHGCGWLFLDTSRNGSRHWCSMKYCGNLAKVRKHRQKAR